ncbi:hypothetical protein Q8A67_022368 [Cirrhinus molitorella]|uniref:Uncharacterized protein n=1 Tax=Cirrhinus molitorella TaxID=172907 RepID=A0AA88P7N3_9TELE|nr:hypothetical protein Q8A67_022368 [Cirrhinus molitorella]
MNVTTRDERSRGRKRTGEVGIYTTFGGRWKRLRLTLSGEVTPGGERLDTTAPVAIRNGRCHASRAGTGARLGHANLERGLERKVTGNDNMFNKTRPQRQALLSHKRQQREAEGESERARSRMVCVNPSPPLLRWPSPWSTPEPGQSEAITPTINSCSASLSMQIEGGRRLGKLFTALLPPPHLAVRPSHVVWRSAEPGILTRAALITVSPMLALI